MKIQPDLLTSLTRVPGRERTAVKERKAVSRLLAEKLPGADRAAPAVKVSISGEGMEAWCRAVKENG